jgi:hypothetical protein
LYKEKTGYNCRLKILPDWAIEEDGFVLANQSLSVSIGFLNPTISKHKNVSLTNQLKEAHFVFLLL